MHAMHAILLTLRPCAKALNAQGHLRSKVAIAAKICHVPSYIVGFIHYGSALNAKTKHQELYGIEERVQALVRKVWGAGFGV
jgi:hypothetical protein